MRNCQKTDLLLPKDLGGEDEFASHQPQVIEFSDFKYDGERNFSFKRQRNLMQEIIQAFGPDSNNTQSDDEEPETTGLDVKVPEVSERALSYEAIRSMSNEFPSDLFSEPSRHPLNSV